jgi:hypothetical protein
MYLYSLQIKWDSKKKIFVGRYIFTFVYLERVKIAKRGLREERPDVGSYTAILRALGFL